MTDSADDYADKYINMYKEELKAGMYKPGGTPVFTENSGVISPEGIAEKVRAMKFGEDEAKLRSDQSQKDRLKKTGVFAENLKKHFKGEATIDDVDKAVKLQKTYGESPAQAVNVLKTILAPIMENYVKDVPAVGDDSLSGKIQRLLYGTARSITPDFLRGSKVKEYNDYLSAYKGLIAKGLFGNPGNLTESEQEDPLDLMPGDWDSDRERKNRIKNFYKLLNQYSGEYSGE